MALNTAFIGVSGAARVAGVVAGTTLPDAVSARIVVSGITRRAVIRSRAEMRGSRMTRLLIRRSIKGASQVRRATRSGYRAVLT
jgi:hypothetical protein